MTERKTPLVLIVNGWTEVVAQDAEAYQDTQERLERAEALQGVQRGLAELLRAKHGIPS